jgi:hypothetical protein
LEAAKVRFENELQELDQITGIPENIPSIIISVFFDTLIYS